MLFVKLSLERHVRIFDMAADEALEAMRGNLVIVSVSRIDLNAADGFYARPGGSDRQSSDQLRPRDGDRLNDLAAESESDAVGPGDFKILQQSDTVLGELLNGIAMIRLAAVPGASAVENNRSVASR